MMIGGEKMALRMNDENMIDNGVIVRSGGFDCDICNQTDLVPSQIELVAAYGSAHDGERVKLKICGDCMDWLFDSISERAQKPKIH